MRNYLKKNILYCILFAGWLAAGCNAGPKVPDVSHIPIQVKIQRFDEHLFRIDTNNVLAGIQLLRDSFPGFTPTYFSQILGLGPFSDTSKAMAELVRQFVGNKDFRALQDSVEAHFSNTAPLEKELTQAFRLAKYYLPRFEAPKVVSFISAIGNYGAVTVDSLVGIGLDMHMGADFSIYRMLPDYPDYIVRKFTPEYIPVNVMKVLEQHYAPAEKEGAKLIERFISLGRQQYFLQMVLPGTPEHIRLGYTKAQLAFCDGNEQMVWQYFVQNKLLYTADWQEVMRYTGEGPSTQGLPAEAPGQVGAFAGYRIVQAFMKKHPDVTLEKLMNMRDATAIFNGAKYRP
ncbi:hypothetical protein DLD77_09315 [Chitinophaga alhagiae]|uniref:Gliding motility lipoprotein GldB n=1 Tax=Chitinophaga alhagiae TaxID=2203219 RepID=A0ABN5LSF8_9BACT|nr:hypothetical protein [Chitinophaga alhagiae]AWO01879.1 hypothetical protein DLD77_09315 [Chitinophaga alhagiae]